MNQLKENRSVSLSPIRQNIYSALSLLFPFSFAFLIRIKFEILRPIHKQYIQFSPTYDCQCQCQHCGMGQYHQVGEKLSTDEVKRIIDNAVTWGFGQIDFFGGEPLLDQNLFMYIRHAARQGIFTHINTNGLLLTPENVDRLYACGLSALSISFDSFDEKTHNRNRGRDDAFRQALAGAERCIQKKIRTIMSIYATPEEVKNGNTKKLIELAKQKRFYRVRVLTRLRTGNLCHTEITPQDYDLQKLNEIIADKEFVKPHGLSKCFITHKTTVYISPTGDVQPCSMTPITFGNIRKESFAVILNRLRNHPLTNIETQGCVMNSAYMKKNFFDVVDLTKTPLPIPVSQLAFSPETN